MNDYEKWDRMYAAAGRDAARKIYVGIPYAQDAADGAQFDADVRKLKSLLDRWAGGGKRKKSRSSDGRSYVHDTYDDAGNRIIPRSVAFDSDEVQRARIEDLPISTEIIGDYFRPETTISDAILHLDNCFGDREDAGGYLPGVKYYLCTLRKDSTVREIPNKSYVSAAIARLENAA